MVGNITKSKNENLPWYIVTIGKNQDRSIQSMHKLVTFTEKRIEEEVSQKRNTTNICEKDVLNIDKTTIGFSCLLDKKTREKFVSSGFFVEANQVVKVSAAPKNWGLNRMDQMKLPLDNLTYNPEFRGNGVRIYILDTGINSTHTQFQGKLALGYNGILKKEDTNSTRHSNDGHGHGTHCASSAAGISVGVAPGAILVPVKVLSDGGSGRVDDIIKSIDWVINKEKSNETGKIISMSLGGGKSTAFNNKVKDAVVNHGFIVAVAAGNERQNAANVSPASTKEAITVGAMDIKDKHASFSNFGELVDVYGPGVSIYGAWKGSATAYNTISGTSMATPHIAGLAALYWEEDPSASNEVIEEKISLNRGVTLVDQENKKKVISVIVTGESKNKFQRFLVGKVSHAFQSYNFGQPLPTNWPRVNLLSISYKDICQGNVSNGGEKYPVAIVDYSPEGNCSSNRVMKNLKDNEFKMVVFHKVNGFFDNYVNFEGLDKNDELIPIITISKMEGLFIKWLLRERPEINKDIFSQFRIGSIPKRLQEKYKRPFVFDEFDGSDLYDPKLIIKDPKNGSKHFVEYALSYFGQNKIPVGNLTEYEFTHVNKNGCTPEEFNEVDLTGKIAVVKRGSCLFYDKTINAANAGAIYTLLENTKGSAIFKPNYYGQNPEKSHGTAMIKYTDGQLMLAMKDKKLSFGIKSEEEILDELFKEKNPYVKDQVMPDLDDVDDGDEGEDLPETLKLTYTCPDVIIQKSLTVDGTDYKPVCNLTLQGNAEYLDHLSSYNYSSYKFSYKYNLGRHPKSKMKMSLITKAWKKWSQIEGLIWGEKRSSKNKYWNLKYHWSGSFIKAHLNDFKSQMPYQLKMSQLDFNVKCYKIKNKTQRRWCLRRKQGRLRYSGIKLEVNLELK